MNQQSENRWVQIKEDGQIVRVALLGSWRMRNLEEIDETVSKVRINSSQKALIAQKALIDGAGLEDIDTAGAMMVSRLLSINSLGDEIEYVNITEKQKQIFEITRSCTLQPPVIGKNRLHGFLEKVGRSSEEFLQVVCAVAGFIGQTAAEFLRVIANPSSLRIKELTIHIEQAGIDAIPIVFLVNFLIGIVVAYLTGVQIEQYGASIFIVDGVSLATCRELSPILVAIIVAGRSGSAFTAQIGSMKLNEEIDAMITLGLSPLRVLVFPRLLALMIFMPCLVFVGDLAGIAGGMFIADLRLGVTGATFIERLALVLPLKHVLVGMVKAPVFAFFIATIGCHMGLTVENNARSVGINTTQTVVRSIVSVILLNAAFAVVLSELGI